MRRVLLEAMHVAAARGERQVGVRALLIAALDDPDGGARGVVSALGGDASSLQRQLRGDRRA